MIQYLDIKVGDVLKSLKAHHGVMDREVTVVAIELTRASISGRKVTIKCNVSSCKHCERYSGDRWNIETPDWTIVPQLTDDEIQKADSFPPITDLERFIQ